MKTILFPFCLVLAFASETSVLAAPRAAELPVSISAANYRLTPRDELARMIEHAPAVLNPNARDLQPLAAPQHFVFVAGETLASDLDFPRVTAQLAIALAAKGYLNAADARGAIAAPEKITLVLRVTHGTRTWRLPIVRTEHLTWSDGLVPQPRGRLGIAGAHTAWDRRAGGDAYFEFDRTPNRDAPGFDETRDFHLLVVDAFDSRELKQQGNTAKRVWTTFVAVPQAPREKFSAIAAILVRAATPYFGETARGLQVLPGARTDVRIGEPVETKVSARNAAAPKPPGR